MDIAKLKASLPSLNPALLRSNLNSCRNIALNILKNLDLKYLAIGIASVAIIYTLIFFYIYMVSTNTITKIESKLASEIVPVDFIKQSPNYDNNLNIDKKISIKSIMIDGLYENTPIGTLPIIRKEDQLTSFRAYQHPFNFPKTDKPIISFVIKDYGLSKESSKTALDLLPPEVSFILSPYADMPNEWIKLAQDKGHEVWLDLPIQNKKILNSGKNTIFHHSSIRKKQEAMRRTMSRSSGYTGLSAYTDSSMNLASEDYMKLVDEIYARGLGFFEINPNAPKMIENKAANLFSPYIKADLEIFRVKGKNNSFETLEQIAKDKGHAIAVIPSYPKTIKNLAVWILKVAQSDYVITPASAIYDLPLHNTSPSNLHREDHASPTKEHH